MPQVDEKEKRKIREKKNVGGMEFGMQRKEPLYLKHDSGLLPADTWEMHEQKR